jgi:uncharacterized protein (TIGR02271 family)
MSTLTGGLDRYIDYDVVDDHEHKVGTLNSLWVDRGGHPMFLGIKTGVIFGKTHVVPTEVAKINQSGRSIRLPYSEDMIKGAPAFEADKDLDITNEREVYRYFHLGEPGVAEARFTTESRPAAAEVKVPSPEALTTPLAAPKQEKAAGITSQPAASARPAAEEGRMFLSEELLKVGKRIVDAGGVRLHKVIRTETVTLPVELSHEEIVIERIPAQGTQPAAVEAFMEKDVYIALHREEPVVQKESRVREEVRCRTQPHIEKRTVSDSIRKEDVEVLKEGEEASRVKAKSN